MDTVLRFDGYNSLAGFTVPPYSPPNFVPLAYSDRKERTVKLLRVPITDGPP